MKKILIIFITVLTGLAATGCGTTAKQIAVKYQNERTDVFTEIKAGEMIPKGFADLTIKANIKTHLEGYYILESSESLHGKQWYPFLINIDGQAAVWKVDGVRESKPKYDKDGKTSLDPEAGDGMKYSLEKRLRLTAGTHKIFFGLPEDDYFIEKEIALTERVEHVLEFKPVYKYKTIPFLIPSFLRGISKYEVYFDSFLLN